MSTSSVLARAPGLFAQDAGASFFPFYRIYKPNSLFEGTSNMLRTFSESILAKVAFAPAALTNATVTGTSVDTRLLDSAPYRRAALVVNINTGSATTANFILYDSPDNSTWTAVPGATLAAAVVASTSALQVVNIDLSRRARYLRVSIVGTGTAGATAAELYFFTGSVAAPTQGSAALTV